MKLLLPALFVLLTTYGLLMYAVMKRTMSWRHKAFVYGALTFLMLLAVFSGFAHYEKYWKG